MTGAGEAERGVVGEERGVAGELLVDVPHEHRLVRLGQEVGAREQHRGDEGGEGVVLREAGLDLLAVTPELIVRSLVSFSLRP